MTTSTPPTALTAARTTGGLNATYLRLELRRLVRNRRTVIFSLVMPPVFFLIFGMNSEYKTEDAGNGNVTAWILVSMALYGALLTATAGGASVSVERAQGWTRQLRLTPLRPAVYVATKLAAAMTLGAVSVAVTMLVGLVTGGASMPFTAWVSCALIAWAGSIVFAAFGLFMGYLLPAENVMQILGPVLALLSFAGGLFVPLGDNWFADVAKATPTYGLAELTRAPLGDGFSWVAVVNVVAWAAVFSLGAAWRYRKDTARV
ncbi:ABC transporter permease [Luteimicrobium subarcticum]|uniref:ABC-2 type transport system permease protein n=1 Tax=Luteimicrobium subarcticum TaxID=620910 RepID=A0A2M8WR17_9MICO|nr:ABC transporter permease [Luteimicrobium subarcticum]PJI93385.1 ABC-2 type transport system permease protein [Luteimicrobium subarcticum]